MTKNENIARTTSEPDVRRAAFEPRRKDVVSEHLSVERVLADLREMLKLTPHPIAEAPGADIATIRKCENGTRAR